MLLVRRFSDTSLQLAGQFKDMLVSISTECRAHADQLTARYLEQQKDQAQVQRETNEVVKANTAQLARVEKALEGMGGVG